MRAPWPNEFPPVFTHAAWELTQAAPCLPDFPDYWPAKKRRNTVAAVRLCDAVAQEPVLEKIYDTCFSDDANAAPPLVAVPALTPAESGNALAIAYAKWLAKSMGWETDNRIFQARSVNRDFTTSGWFRLVQQPEFYGIVERGRRYVLADDVCTMGGTLASLRGFIEYKGGRVICMTVLATCDGRHVPIAISDETLSRIAGAHGGELARLVRDEMGVDAACLTEQEGRFLLRCPSLDAFRAGIDGARN